MTLQVTEAVLERLLVASGLTLVGLLLLLYAVWARRGRSPRARAWMGQGWGSRHRDERMTLLGVPIVGMYCLCGAAVAMADGSPLVLLGAVLVGVLLAPPAVLVFMTWFRVPTVVYPRWARPLHRQNLAAEAEASAWWREQRRRRRASGR